MTLLLPDLSEYEPDADLPGIKRANGGAVIIRVAYGADHTDRVFAEKCAAARAAGFSFIGLYQYIVAGQPIDQQAAVFCDLVEALTPQQIPIADLEEGTGEQYTRFLAWATIVGERLGKRPWLYSNLDYALTSGLAPLFNGAAYHTWVAAFSDTEPALGHTLWQSTNGKAGSNITAWSGCGSCDTNVFHGTLIQLASLVQADVKIVTIGGPRAVSDLHQIAVQYQTTEDRLVAMNPLLQPYVGTGKPVPVVTQILVPSSPEMT